LYKIIIRIFFIFSSNKQTNRKHRQLHLIEREREQQKALVQKQQMEILIQKSQGFEK